jgi:hypothetical protein
MRAFVPVRIVALDRKQRLDIVCGNRRVGATSTFEARGSPRRFSANLLIMRRRHSRNQRHKFRIALIRHKRA